MDKIDLFEVGEWGITTSYSFDFFIQNLIPPQIKAFERIDISKLDISIIFDDKFESIQSKEIVDKFTEGQRPYVIYKENDGYSWILKNSQNENQVIYYIDSTWSKFKIIINKVNCNINYAFSYFAIIFGYAILNKGGIMLHGALMEYEGKGIIVTAPSGTGKTTHVRMWRDEKNALIINGDRSLCKKINNTWYGYGSPWCGSSGEYINRRVPIKAIVVLEQGETNEVSTINKYNSALELISRVFAPKWEKNLMNNALDFIDDIVTEIPVFKLKCTPDIEAVEVLKKEIDKL